MGQLLPKDEPLHLPYLLVVMQKFCCCCCLRHFCHHQFVTLASPILSQLAGRFVERLGYTTARGEVFECDMMTYLSYWLDL